MKKKTIKPTTVYPLTKTMRLKRMYLITLDTLSGSIQQQTKIWESKVSMEEKILFAKEKTKARYDFWELVYKKYPKLKGKNLSSTDYEVTEIN